MRLWLALGALCATLAIAAAIGLGAWNPWAVKYVHGADVSRHQGAIDWRALAKTDVRFVYIKASEGGDHRDPAFAANWRGAGEAGLYRGAYHFFTLCRAAEAQAANFLAAAPREAGALPPAVDVEQKHACRQGPTIADPAGEVRRFLDLVEQRTGARPIVYTTREFHDAHLDGALAGERFWLRALFAEPDFRQKDWVIWQFHHNARRAGVQGPLDLNAFRGDEKALAAFAGRPRAAVGAGS
ncbi:MAG: GH25 family lysozyme [Hyphomonadaceae bacterium]